jgi:cytoskeletal protein CcmA (bactofilin family)
MALLNSEPEKAFRPEHLQDMPQSPTGQTIQPLAEHGASPRQASLASRDTSAYLNQGTRVNGKITFEAQARIDGYVEGEILAKDLLIGESAVVNAQVKTASIVVAGTVQGEITAVQRIEIRPSAKVLGNVTTPRLVVHEGAIFEGRCAMPSEVARDDHRVTVLPKDAVIPKEEAQDVRRQRAHKASPLADPNDDLKRAETFETPARSASVSTAGSGNGQSG